MEVVCELMPYGVEILNVYTERTLNIDTGINYQVYRLLTI